MTPRQSRLLSLLAEFPADLDAEALADLAIPRPALTGTAAYLAWRASIAADRRRARADVTRDLAALVKAGLVERLQPARLADKVAESVDRMAAVYRDEWRTMTRFLGRSRPPTAKEARALGIEAVVRNALPHDPVEIDTAIRLFAALLKGPTPVRKLTGRSPSGATKRAWAMLCDAGLAVPPSRRVPTPEGVRVVEAWRASA